MSEAQPSEQEFLLSLPEDPDESLALFEAWANKERLYNDLCGNEYFNSDIYYDKIIIFCKKLNIEIGVCEDDLEKITNIAKRKIKRIVMESNLVLAQRTKENINPSYELTPAIRIKIHRHISKIKSELEKLDLTDKKRNQLFSKLGKFAISVDQGKTRWDTFGILSVSIAKDAPTCLKDITDLVGVMKNAEEYTQLLIKREDRKLLDAPQKKIEDQSQSNDNMDEEIPF